MLYFIELSILILFRRPILSSRIKSGPEKKTLDSLLNEIICETIYSPSSYDKAIVKGLQKAIKAPLKRLHFHAFFKHGLNNTMLHMIESRENSIRELLVKLPALFVDNFRANEKVIIKLLDCYLLHVLIDKGFCHATLKQGLTNAEFVFTKEMSDSSHVNNLHRFRPTDRNGDQ